MMKNRSNNSPVIQIAALTVLSLLKKNSSTDPFKWHPSALKNSSYRSLPIVFLRSPKLPAPMPLNNPSQALKTLLSRLLQIAPLTLSKLSLYRSLETTSLKISKLSLSIPSNNPSHALKTLFFYPL